jgi:hypothetical protein
MIVLIVPMEVVARAEVKEYSKLTPEDYNKISRGEIRIFWITTNGPVVVTVDELNSYGGNTEIGRV